MKKPVIIIVALFAATILLINGFKGSSAGEADDTANGINWKLASTTHNEITSTGKPVYLFVSTDWCTYCKRMKAQTFADPKVQKLLNELFVPMTINPEKPGTTNFTGEELSYADLAKKLGVTGYPANYFFDATGKLIGGQAGYLDPATFADMAEYIGDGHYANYSFNKFKALPADKRR